jgi:hypothetical protein
MATFLDVVFALRFAGTLALDTGMGSDTEEVGAAVPASASCPARVRGVRVLLLEGLKAYFSERMGV